MENNNNTPVVIDETILATKVEAWGKIGAAFYKNEIQLQAEAQAAIIAIKTPKNIAEVAEFGEATLKSLKLAEKTITEKRKAITERLRVPMERLMLAEKSFAEPIKQLTDVIIAIKKAHEEELKKKTYKDNEIKAIRETASKHLANLKAHFSKKILDQITAAHKIALESDVKVDDINDYVAKCAVKFTAVDFVATMPKVSFSFSTATEVEAILKEIIVVDFNEYIEQYQAELKTKFEFYNIDYDNKIKALEKSSAEASAKSNEIIETKQNEEMAASLETMTTNLDQTNVVKALKKSYKVEMPDDIKSAVIIMTAFTSNLSLCQNKIRVKSIMKLSIEQMAAAIASVKNDDNSFTVTGINFVEVDKL